MRWYVNKEATPSCPIEIERVRSTLAERWQEDLSYEILSEEENIWRSPYQLSKSDREKMVKCMTKKWAFTETINTRNSQSANGPDGIGYSILKLDIESSSTMMALISKAMLKFQKSPTLWNRARTILIYKEGDPNKLDNWRPISIASCMYRVWTATLAAILQAINTNRPIFHRSQKGFIKGVDGCLEHTQVITELFNDACRNRKNLYTITIDLKDAFGSLPHGYLIEMIKEFKLPKEIQGVIKDSYAKGTTVVNLDKLDSTEIRIRKGVKQGCPLSPLMFNLCMNPLLNALQDSNKGYRIGNKVISAQAYADDIILFSESRQGMAGLLDIVERFVAYARLTINPQKCRSLSYILGREGRCSDIHPFFINRVAIPLTDLSKGIEYLGSSAAATICIRYKGTEETIESAKILIDKIMKSQLKVNQKIDAIKRFVIPTMDYTLTEGNPRLKDLEELDRRIRVGLAKHVGVPSFPIPFVESHWKDGGLSLQPLRVRESVLKVKKFISLFNSPNIDTQTLFRQFAESERIYRGIKKVDDPNKSLFLDWETDCHGKIISKNKGTSSIIGTINKECLRIKASIRIKDNTAYAMCYSDEEAFEIESPKKISQTLMHRYHENAYKNLIEQGMHGHSFINLKNSGDSNYLIGNHTNKVSDKVISFMIAARTNEIYTGYISYLNGKDNGPKCPYCGAIGEKDTLFHRLNNCNNAKYMYTYRHNLVASAIIKQIQQKFPRALIRQNQTVRITGLPTLTSEEGKLKPDITVILPEEIILIEISCPYDTPTDENTSALDKTYNTKKNKYEELRRQCEELYRRRCKLYVVIVSSLGAIHKDTIMDLKHMFRIKKDQKTLKYITRKISTAAIIGSFLTFNKIVTNRNGGHTTPVNSISNDTIGDVTMEEQDFHDNSPRN